MASKNYGLGGVGSSVELGKGGARVKNSSGVVEARNNADNAYAKIRADHPTGMNDVVTLQYLKTKGDVVVTGQIDGGAPPAAGTPGRVYVCTTTGGGYTVNHLYFDNGASWDDVGPAEGQSMAVTDALSGGAVTFLADHAYLWDTDGTVWVDLGPSAGSASKHLVQRTVDIIHTSGAVNVGAEVSANGRVLTISINVTQAFNGTAPTLTVGDAGDADRFATVDESNLKEAGLYRLDVSHLYSVLTQVTATVVPDGSSAGAANITLTYAEA
jgi:hypothetical protein